ncbi:hypothetical protein SDC9_183957 [bioreactor metagenome]|uniref:Uncharacterized protein n=1 Tax=bioreactor metagenome TaxID=1076179 RepID=A0A645HBP0_9ZZZZ
MAAEIAAVPAVDVGAVEPDVAAVRLPDADHQAGERRLAGAAGTGNAEHRRFQRGSRLEQRLLERRRLAVLEQRDDA